MHPAVDAAQERSSTGTVTLFLSGDVMTGRGIDQVLPHPSKPGLRESYVTDAREYVALAEARNGPVKRPIPFSYVWGDALEAIAEIGPSARVINLETSVTVSDAYCPRKGIHYRMHPGNVPTLQAAGIDACVLANNHVLDFGRAGLLETLRLLHAAGIRTAGAGQHLADAQRPATIELASGARVLLFAFCTEDSGVPKTWAAGAQLPGVNVLDDLSLATADEIGARVRASKRAGDIAIATVHWGSNWGYEVPAKHVRFARGLVDAGVDLVHGHSSHHPRPIEVYRGHLVLYGCGDLINDYEGIAGYESFRPDLSLLYFPTIDRRDGSLVGLRMTPMQTRRLRLVRPSPEDASWLASTLDEISRPFGARIASKEAGFVLG